MDDFKETIDEATMTVTYNDECESYTFPFQYEVCMTCQGTGTHVNREIDGNGLSDENLADEDFMEEYLQGSYDMVCEECHGRRVVPVIDEDKADQEELKAYYGALDSYAETRAIHEAERRKLTVHDNLLKS